MIKYEALCIGGPMAGQFHANTTPEFEVRIRSPLVLNAHELSDRRAIYYFVPLVGLRGFWLFEDETKGRQPYDDIIRVLCDSYVKHQDIVRKAGGRA